MPEGPPGACWSVYIVRCRDGSLYTGIATDVLRRLDEHRAGRIGARYLRGRAPLELAGSWPVGTRSMATRVERRIKGMRRAQKESLLAGRVGIRSILATIERAANLTSTDALRM